MSFHGNRVTQNRPQKENINRELAEAKREVHQLRREVARLTKQLEKELAREIHDNEQNQEATPLLPPVINPDACPDCDKTVKIISIGPKTLRACTCGWRKTA